MRKKLFYLNFLLWWLGIIKNCPKCSAKLINVGKGGWGLYKCSNPECDFGKKHTRYPLEIWRR